MSAQGYKFFLKKRIEILNIWILCMILYIKMDCRNYKSSLEKLNNGSKNVKNREKCAM